jgi:DNA (cytosine-5)-methyltransferase 1
VSKPNFYFKYVDLFAGVGGFAAALNANGGEFLAGAETDEPASKVYLDNFGHYTFGDVKALADMAQELENFEVLTGGFPCQPFSKSGAQRGTTEKRGTLFDEIERIVTAKKPLIILLENVRNLAGPRHLDEWKRIIKVLRKHGYRVSSRPAEFSPHLLPKSLGGRPQHRVRIFITATLNPGSDGKNVEEPEPVVTLKNAPAQTWDLKLDLPLDEVVGDEYSLQESELIWLNAWNEWLKYWSYEEFGHFPSFPLWSDYWRSTKPSDYAEMPKWKQLIVSKNLDFFAKHRTFADRWLTSHEVRSNFPATKRKFEWQAKGSKTIWENLIQFRPSGIRVKAPTYVPTLVALNQTPIYGPYKRRLTEIEASRLQGFPAKWNPGSQSPSKTYKQMGNAVNIAVIAHVLRMHCLRDQDILKVSKSGRDLLKALETFGENPDHTFALWNGKVAPI